MQVQPHGTRQLVGQRREHRAAPAHALNHGAHNHAGGVVEDEGAAAAADVRGRQQLREAVAAQAAVQEGRVG